jgi:putative transposase
MAHGRPPRITGFAYLGVHQYALTLCTFERLRIFTQPLLVAAAHHEIARTCEEHAFIVLAYCFMPDHVHLVLEGTSDDSDLRACLKRSRQRVAYVLRTRFGIPRTWQDGYFDHVLRASERTNVVVRYVLDNPVRAGLVARGRLPVQRRDVLAGGVGRSGRVFPDAGPDKVRPTRAPVLARSGLPVRRT